MNPTDFPEAAEEMRKIMDAVRAVRNRRAEMNVPPSRKTHLYLATASAGDFPHAAFRFLNASRGRARWKSARLSTLRER